MSSFFRLCALLLSIFLHISQARQKCQSKCRIQLCRETLDAPPVPHAGIRFRLRPFYEPMGGVFCQDGVLLDKVALAEAYVRSSLNRERFMSISKYAPPGLSRRFSRNFFTSTQALRIGTSLSRAKTLGNQNLYTNDLCIHIPVIRKQPLNNRGFPIGPINVTFDHEDCIAFKTMTSKVIISLTYNSLADFDLHVFEPPACNSTSPFELSPLTPTSPGGGRHTKPKTELKPEECFKSKSRAYRKARRETVRYDLEAPVGLYTVRAFKRDNCATGRIGFVLRVLIDDKEMISKKFTYNGSGGLGSEVFMRRFKYQPASGTVSSCS